MMCTHDDLNQTLENLEILGTAARRELLTHAALQTGGYVKIPELENTWDTGKFEVKVHNLFAEGDDITEVIRNWMKIARSHALALRQTAKALQISQGSFV